jgi:hypothetical protein
MNKQINNKIQIIFCITIKETSEKQAVPILPKKPVYWPMKL